MRVQKPDRYRYLNFHISMGPIFSVEIFFIIFSGCGENKDKIILGRKLLVLDLLPAVSSVVLMYFTAAGDKMYFVKLM